MDSETLELPLLPIDLVMAEILHRLPAKSLVRFRCVCKTFKNLILSPEFVRLQLQYTRSSNANRLHILPNRCNKEYRVCGFDLDDPESPAIATFSVYPVSVVGSCNGLLCIRSSNTLYFLNPTTRNYKDTNCVSDSTLSLGFGFDDIDEDYKVVKLRDHHLGNNAWERKVSVYSLRKNSWKSVVEQQVPQDTLEVRNVGVLIGNCLLHWMFWSSSKRKRRIGCFDIHSEQWTDDVLMPDFYYDYSCQGIYLLDIGVLDDCLSCTFKNQNDSSFDVWVMKEYGVKHSWIKLFKIPMMDNLYGEVAPVASRRGIGSEVLVKQRHGPKLFWFNSKDNTVIKAKYVCLLHEAPHVYKESLVEVPGGESFGDHGFILTRQKKDQEA